ncbi:MAG: gliding motility protein GldN [Bacteroidales bacterium]|nr:gliding motility protein GldN [Bacteroidales bacterium]
MWSKIVWRMVDLREKMNLQMIFPTKPIGERMSLMSLLLYGIDNEGLQVYNPNSEFDEFKVAMTKADIDINLDAVEKTTQVVDANNNTKDTTYKQDRQIEQVKKLLIKEKWYFDKQHSTMQVRILGLCPIRVYPRQIQGQNASVESGDEAEILMKPVFWVYYPEARNLLSSHPVFTRFNDAQQVSFDDLFMQRRFSGYIFKESNVYNNRRIEDYTTGVEALLEADRIKQYLFEVEHDLWEY